MKATAIVPVKRFGAAKQRLTDALEPEARRLLSAAMLTDVLAAIARCEAVERTLLVSGEPGAAEIGRAAGAAVIEDPDDAGHSEAALLGIAAAGEAGARAVALLPGDCPILDPVELAAALEAAGPGSVGVIPDRHGTGSNGLILSPADAIVPAFGPGSCERHMRLAAEAGRRGEVVRLESLALDLDTGDDLRALRRLLATDPGRAPATAAALAAAGTTGDAVGGGR